VREVRELTRSQATLVAERTQAVNRLHKLLEGANLKRGAVASDVLGKSGRDMLEAILAGEGDPQTLAERARGRLRAKLPLLRQALDGRVQAFQRVVLRHLLDQIDFLERQVAHLVVASEERLAPVAEAVALLETIPCVGHTAATTSVAELGDDMSRCASACTAQTSGLLGRRLSREQAERWQAAGRQDPQREYLAAGDLR
jgi:transposase